MRRELPNENRGNGPLTTKVILAQERLLDYQKAVLADTNDMLEGAWALISSPYSVVQRVGFVTRVDLIHGEFAFTVDMVHWRTKNGIDYPRDKVTGRYRRLLGPRKSGSQFFMKHVKFLDRPRAIPGVDFERKR